MDLSLSYCTGEISYKVLSYISYKQQSEFQDDVELSRIFVCGRKIIRVFGTVFTSLITELCTVYRKNINSQVKFFG